MGQLRLPDGAQADYRLVSTDAFGGSFSIHVYGAGRKGWFVASLRDDTGVADAGPRPLRKGEWRTFLNFVRQCRFWALPPTLPDPPDVMVDDGEWLTVAGREGERFHLIRRFIWREPGLEQLLSYCRRLSTFFPRPTHDPAAAGGQDRPQME